MKGKRYCPMCEAWVPWRVCLDCDTKTLPKEPS